LIAASSTLTIEWFSKGKPARRKTFAEFSVACPRKRVDERRDPMPQQDLRGTFIAGCVAFGVGL
jgi:hypothetical protein